MPSLDVVTQLFDAATVWKTALYRWPSNKAVEPVPITTRPVYCAHVDSRHSQGRQNEGLCDAGVTGWIAKRD